MSRTQCEELAQKTTALLKVEAENVQHKKQAEELTHEVRKAKESESTKTSELLERSRELEDARANLRLRDDHLHEQRETLSSREKELGQAKEGESAKTAKLIETSRELEETRATLQQKDSFLKEQMATFTARQKEVTIAQFHLEKMNQQLQAKNQEATVLQIDVGNLNQQLQATQQELSRVAKAFEVARLSNQKFYANAQALLVTIQGAGGAGKVANGKYEHVGFFRGRPKFKQVHGECIIFCDSCWRINVKDDETGWIYSGAGSGWIYSGAGSGYWPPLGRWTTDGYDGGDAEPAPLLSMPDNTKSVLKS
jgi:hypothetical protein